MYKTIDPNLNQVLEAYPQLTEEQLKRRLDSAQKAFTHWAEVSVDQRVEVIKRVAQSLEDNLEACAKTITYEMGKPLQQARGELRKCISLCQYYAEEGPTHLSPRSEDADGVENLIVYQPIGAVLGVMPWNFPFWQVFRYAVPSLLAGNVVLLKPAPNVPESGLLIESLFAEAYPVHTIFETLLISVDQVPEVIAHPLVQGVTLTGSDRAGAEVAALAGKNLKKCVMELGGSDPFIILDDADLEQAVDAAIKSRFNNSGQTCIAAKRLILHHDIYDAAMSMITTKVRKLKLGDPLDEDTDIGPLARPDLLDRLEDQVRKTIDAGASVVVSGGVMPEMEGNFFSPVVLTDIPRQTPAREEELFGPVLSVFKVQSDDEAIALANDTHYGLGAAVWSNNSNRARHLAMKVNSGTVVINGITKSDPRLPFGGIKQSGFGRELGPEGIREFTNIKTIIVTK